MPLNVYEKKTYKTINTNISINNNITNNMQKKNNFQNKINGTSFQLKIRSIILIKIFFLEKNIIKNDIYYENFMS